MDCFNPETKRFGEEREIGGKVLASENDTGFLNAVFVNQYWVESHALRLVCDGERRDV